MPLALRLRQLTCTLSCIQPINNKSTQITFYIVNDAKTKGITAPKQRAADIFPDPCFDAWRKVQMLSSRSHTEHIYILQGLAPKRENKMLKDSYIFC